MTGWGAGVCATGRRPTGYGYGYGGYGYGRGLRGRGRGMGLGRAWGWGGDRGPFYGGYQPAAYPPADYSPEAERAWLAAEAEDLKARLGEVENRLVELEGVGGSEACSPGN